MIDSILTYIVLQTRTECFEFGRVFEQQRLNRQRIKTIYCEHLTYFYFTLDDNQSVRLQIGTAGSDCQTRNKVYVNE